MMRSVLACALALLALPVQAAEKYGISTSENLRFLDDMAKRPGMVSLPDGVMYRVLKSGSGQAPASRLDKVTVSYTGYLINGGRFDHSRPEKPSSFFISRVIPGWSEVLMKMHEGDLWEVIIPADQGYGDGSSGAVPPGQTLLFNLQLDHVEHHS
jgi:FKBP-type peptidyl-prolyl cis-trans isomerase FklB